MSQQRASQARDELDQYIDPFYDLYYLSLSDAHRAMAKEKEPRDAEPQLATVATQINESHFDHLVRLHAVARALVRRPELIETDEDAAALAVAVRPDDQDPQVPPVNESDVAAGIKEFATSLKGTQPLTPPPELTPSLWAKFLTFTGFGPVSSDERSAG